MIPLVITWHLHIAYRLTLVVGSIIQEGYINMYLKLQDVDDCVNSRTSQLRHQLIDGRPVLRILGPAQAKKFPHVVVQSTFYSTHVLGTVWPFLVVYLLYHLGASFEIGVWFIVRK